jgi:hypothetical protein
MGFLIEIGALVLVVAWLLRSSGDGQHPARLAHDVVSEFSKRHKWALGAVVVLIALVLRVPGMDRSLWLDEFGTLWVVEEGASETIRRVFAFQGQSPFYYLIVRLFVWLLGESEAVLRLPSLLAGLATIGVLYWLGKEIWDESSGIAAAMLGAISFPLVSASANARPYMLAGLMMAVFMLGFARAVKHGQGADRLLFILGGIGLFSTHYLLAAAASGVGLAYVSIRSLRVHYPWKQFAMDIVAQALGVAVWIPHLATIWGRRAGLSWLGEPDWPAWLEGVLPLLVVALAGVHLHRNAGRNQNRAFELALWITVATPVALLALLALRGTNLIEDRYIFGILIPAILLAARSLLMLKPALSAVPAGYGLLVTALYFAVQLSVSGSLTGAGRQDWRNATAFLEDQTPPGSSTPVLFRSGFVEQDRVLTAQLPEVILAPLRSPQRQVPSWKPLPLTYRWDNLPGRDDYFDRVVLPVVRNSEEFYFLSCRCYNDWTGNYAESLRQWVDKTLPGSFTSEEREAGNGIVILHFVQRGERLSGDWAIHSTALDVP